jgi:phage I-like protein
LSSREEVFVQYIASGMDARMAYLKAFPTNDPHYAGLRAGQLIKTTRIRTAMKEELKPVLEELGINETSILRNIYTIAMSSEKDETKLKALFKLADVMDLEDKNKTSVTQISGAVFEGFKAKEIETAQRPVEIESNNAEDTNL